MAAENEGSPLPSFESFMDATLEIDGLHYQLDGFLGRGLTALVFRGELAAGEDGAGRRFAFKVARDEARFRDALVHEWENLELLGRVERRSGTHYFPRAIHRVATIEPPVPFLVPGQPSSFAVLVQELVPGRDVHDLLQDYPPGLRLPETLALEIGRQYADLLALLHGAGIACADRKLADLRWTSGGGAAGAGSLCVLDWNVTAKAIGGEAGTIAIDLLRFAALWHWMLLGVQPRFRQKGQLLVPLARDPNWEQLSFGTREILARLLHADAGERYPDAESLRRDLVEQARRWTASGVELEAAYQPVYRLYVEMPEALPDSADLRRALAAADVRRLRDGASPVTATVCRSLRRGLRDAPFGAIRGALDRAQWELAGRAVAERRLEGSDPAVLLLLWRYAAIAAHGAEHRSSRAELKPLLERSESLFALDALDADAASEGSAGVEDDSSVGGGGGELAARLADEAGYRRSLAEARRLREGFLFREARRAYDRVVLRRQRLLAGNGEAVSWIDQLYGDPAPEIAAIEEILAAADDRGAIVRRALQCLAYRLPLDEVGDRLTRAVLAEPEDRRLVLLLRLLQEEGRYREAEAERDPLFAERSLARLGSLWAELRDALAPAGGRADSPANPEEAPALELDDVDFALEQRRDDMKQRSQRLAEQGADANHLVSVYLNSL